MKPTKMTHLSERHPQGFDRLSLRSELKACFSSDRWGLHRCAIQFRLDLGKPSVTRAIRSCRSSRLSNAISLVSQPSHLSQGHSFRNSVVIFLCKTGT